MDRTNMPLSIAKNFLKSCVRSMEKDELTGANEISWRRDNRKVAWGLFSSCNNGTIVIAYVKTVETKRFFETMFADEEAESLRSLGSEKK